MKQRQGRPAEGAISKQWGRGRVSGYVGEDMKRRVIDLIGYLGFTSESHFVQYAVEEAVTKAEKEVAGIRKVYHVLKKRT